MQFVKGVRQIICENFYFFTQLSRKKTTGGGASRGISVKKMSQLSIFHLILPVKKVKLIPDDKSSTCK